MIHLERQYAQTVSCAAVQSAVGLLFGLAIEGNGIDAMLSKEDKKDRDEFDLSHLLPCSIV